MSYNPFSGWRVTGNWQDHMSYSLGGTDYPLPYGSALPAPAAGTLRTSGGSGERRAGDIGSAGRRSILDLDTPLGDMVSIVFQHQSRFGEHGKHYDERETLGWSGASANGRDWGGDVHLHIHGLDKHGNRVDYTTHISSSTAGEGITLITSGETDMKHIYHPDRGYAIIWDEGAYGYPDTDIDAIVAKGIEPSIIYDHAWQWDTEVREANIRGDAMRALQTKHTLAALKVAGVQVDVDEAAIAKQIAGLLPTPTADSIKIAKATADEIDARNRARLGK